MNKPALAIAKEHRENALLIGHMLTERRCYDAPQHPHATQSNVTTDHTQHGRALMELTAAWRPCRRAALAHRSHRSAVTASRTALAQRSSPSALRSARSTRTFSMCSCGRVQRPLSCSEARPKDHMLCVRRNGSKRWLRSSGLLSRCWTSRRRGRRSSTTADAALRRRKPLVMAGLRRCRTFHLTGDCADTAGPAGEVLRLPP